MSEVAERYRKVASEFTRRVRAVPDDAWDNPSPCEGWVARDIRHLIEWMPGFFLGSAGVEAPEVPSVDADPAGAWARLDDAIQAALDAPDIAGRDFETRVMGRVTVEQAVDRFGTDDVLIHTWDLARATGLDERLDPDEVRRVLSRLHEVNEELLRSSGQFGPRVDVPDDADEQTKLIAFTGRRP